MKNKYFATRCVQGNVNIWSATHHPDRLFTIEHMDKDDQPSGYGENTMISKAGAHGEEHNQSMRNMTMTQGGGYGVNGPQSSEKDKMLELRYRL